MARKPKRPPLACYLCGEPRWNDASVVWITLARTWGVDERLPFCAGECADHITRVEARSNREALRG